MADPYREADRLQAVEAALREHTEQVASSTFQRLCGAPEAESTP